MVNYDLLKEQMQHNDEKNPFVMPTWSIILIRALGTFIGATSLVAYCYCKHGQSRNKKPNILSAIWCKMTSRTRILWLLLPVHLRSLLLPTQKVKATPEKERETLELSGMDFSDFDKYKAHHNNKDTKKTATTSV